jgi:hypothetical protein
VADIAALLTALALQGHDDVVIGVSAGNAVRSCGVEVTVSAMLAS